MHHGDEILDSSQEDETDETSDNRRILTRMELEARECNDVYILGTGASLAHLSAEEVQRINRCPSISMNGFMVATSTHGIRPRYHIVAGELLQKRSRWWVDRSLNNSEPDVHWLADSAEANYVRRHFFRVHVTTIRRYLPGERHAMRWARSFAERLFTESSLFPALNGELKKYAPRCHGHTV